MSAFGGKADIGVLRRSAFAVAIGCKADMACWPHMSAFDPKRTLISPSGVLDFAVTMSA